MLYSHSHNFISLFYILRISFFSRSLLQSYEMYLTYIGPNSNHPGSYGTLSDVILPISIDIHSHPVYVSSFTLFQYKNNILQNNFCFTYFDTLPFVLLLSSHKNVLWVLQFLSIGISPNSCAFFLMLSDKS